MTSHRPHRFSESDLLDERPIEENSTNQLISVESKQDVSSKNDSETVRSSLSSVVRIAGIIILLLLIGQILDLILGFFQLNFWVGLGFSFLCSIGFGMIGIKLFKWNQGLKWLNKQSKLKSKLQITNVPTSYGKALPIIKEIHNNRNLNDQSLYLRYISECHICQNDSEIVQLYSERVVSNLDKQAREVITKHALDSSILVAFSPFASLDMALVLWRQLRMLKEVSAIYGLKQMPFNRVRILRELLKQMALVGAQEIIMDLSFDSLGLSLSSKLSTRAAQGLGAGLVSLRFGIKAIEYCRPVCFFEKEKMNISNLRADLIQQVKDKFNLIGKKQEN